QCETMSAMDPLEQHEEQLKENLSQVSDRTRQLFAVDCAERVLFLFEQQHPDDARPRQGIEVVRRYHSAEAAPLEAITKAEEAAHAAARDCADPRAQQAAVLIADAVSVPLGGLAASVTSQGLGAALVASLRSEGTNARLQEE